MDNSAPKIRFKGFTDAWVQRKLGEVAEIYDGTHQTPKYTDSGVKFVSVENIATLETTKFISQVAYDKEYSNKQAEKGDVFMTRIGDIGTAKVIDTDEPLAYYVTLALLKPNQINSDFLTGLISSPEVQRDIWKRTLHIAFPKKINLGEINQVELMLPDVKEQAKIGAFFRNLDNLITLHKRKLDGLKELKSGYLQVMFPQSGETVPRVRFNGFEGEWQERKLGEVCSITTGKLDANAMVENGRYDFYTSGIKKYRIDTTAFEGPAITIAGNGATVGYMHLADGKFNAYQRTYVLSNFKANRMFLFSEIGNKLPKKIVEEARTGNIPYIVMNMLTGLKIKFPTLAEQTAIGTFFSSIDEQIADQSEKLEQLNQLKTAYLQKMFI
ncbi:MAG TPA: restriction endonuclease subunit S [Clostridia bacterium]|nr:restriction endonuclease subunit S [Clostridia bacterium]